MLQWKPAVEPDVIVAIQSACATQPTKLLPKELYYYVTQGDLTAEFRRRSIVISDSAAIELFTHLGIVPDKEVLKLSITQGGPDVYVAPMTVLCRQGWSLNWKNDVRHAVDGGRPRVR
jgi:hypothetical protein